MISSPSKKPPFEMDGYGIPKTVFTHISQIHGLLTDWVRVQERGTKICKTVIALKLHECTNDYYPSQLNSLSKSLLEILESMKDIVESVAIINKQLLAISKLQAIPQPVILTWSAKQISETVEQLYKTLKQEFKLKEVITENIAHCRDEKLLEVYATAWEIDTYFKIESTAYLFAEVGLTSIK